MKKFVLFFGLLLVATMINAQAPQGFKYQTAARNNAGEILASQNISFRMTILQGELPGTVVYTETHAATTNASGLATLEIGRGTPVTGDFAAINWSTTPIFLKTEIDPAGGTAFIEMGTSELLSVPFSLYAKSAGNGFSGNYDELTNKPALWDSTWLTIKNKPTTVAGYGITDAMTTAHAANGISTGNIADWNAAFGWGNHAVAGYLTSFTETDPIFGVHPASGINYGNISNWNTAFGWGNHATAGYLTSFTETDPIFGVHPASGINSSNISNWNTAFGWGNHAVAGYLTSFIETDPIFSVHPSGAITTGNISNWNTAFGWGNHATAGYLTSFTETDPIFSVHPASGINSGNITNWNTAFGWGNHATVGYLTSFTETDPIFGAWDKSIGINITSSQVSDFEESVTNNPAMLANTAKNSYPAADAAKLAGIEAGAEVNVNADWNATNGDAQILNKPAGQNPGDMLYWNGTQWIPVPVGSNDQVLKLNNLVPTWSSFAQKPSLITTAVTGISMNNANSGGNVSDGGDLVTQRGVCWSISPNPTIANDKTNDGSGSGTYSSNISNLTPATTYFIRAYATNGVGTGYGNEFSFTTEIFLCGTSITISHTTSGGIAPVEKTVTYGTVTNIPGETSKCWITRNLGASQQATAANDATEASAGWYWQYNRKQGYKHDGTNRTPNTVWITSIVENSDWTTENDPCALEIGSGWRIPTSTEWTNVDASGNWTTSSGPYNSGLKLHTAGIITEDGTSDSKGINGLYWSSNQYNNSNGWYLVFNIYQSSMGYGSGPKARGFTIRCINGN